MINSSVKLITGGTDPPGQKFAAVTLGACRTYASRLDFCPSLQKQTSYLLLPSRLRSFSPPFAAAFSRYRSALSRSLSDLRLTARFLPFSPVAALPKYSRSPATLRFCRLASGKNHQKSPRSLKIRQTPRYTETIDSHTLLLRCQNTHAAQLCLSFCRLASGKNHQNRLNTLKFDRLLAKCNPEKTIVYSGTK